VRLTTSPPSCAECHEIWEPKPPGTLWAMPGLLRDDFTFNVLMKIKEHQHHIQIHRQEKCVVTYHNTDQGHRILFGNNRIIAGKPRYIDWQMIVRMVFFLSVDLGNHLFTPLKKKGLQAAYKDNNASLILTLPHPSQPWALKKAVRRLTTLV
jgi:hypothetical protein